MALSVNILAYLHATSFLCLQNLHSVPEHSMQVFEGPIREMLVSLWCLLSKPA